MNEQDAQVLVEDDETLRWLSFNRPDKHNALSATMVEEATAAVRQFDADGELRVLAITGGINRTFTAGADIGELQTRSGEAEREYIEKTTALVEAIRHVRKPVIAMISGYCVGAGVAIASACDLRYASSDATITIPAPRLGIAYGVTFTRALLEVVGPAAAREMLYSGARYDADEAMRIGFLNRVYPHGNLYSEGAKMIAAIVRNAPLSILSAKSTVAHLVSGEPDRAACEALVQACADSEDYAEGLAAAVAERHPVFTGK